MCKKKVMPGHAFRRSHISWISLTTEFVLRAKEAGQGQHHDIVAYGMPGHDITVSHNTQAFANDLSYRKKAKEQDSDAMITEPK